MFPTKTIASLRGRPLFGRECLHAQKRVALVVVEPGNLKRVVPFEHSVGIIVDRLAGAREQPGGRIVLAEDQVRIGWRLRCKAMRTAIWPIVVRASEYAPPKVCEPSST